MWTWTRHEHHRELFRAYEAVAGQGTVIRGFSPSKGLAGGVPVETQPFTTVHGTQQGIDAPDIHDLPARQQGREFLVWKALFLESRSKGITDECMFALLKKHQPKFDLCHTIYQLQYLHGLKPFKNETLEQLIK